MPSLLIVGHSYVNRLRDYLDPKKENRSNSFTLTTDTNITFTVSLYSVSGSCLSDFTSESQDTYKELLTQKFWDLIKSYPYNVVLFLLGGNDINVNTPVDTIKENIRKLYTKFSENTPPNTIRYFTISHIEARFLLTEAGEPTPQAAKFDVEQEDYNKKAKQINNFLKHNIKKWKNAHTFQLNKTVFGKPEQYEHDGIHLNSLGNQLLWEEIRKFMKYLHEEREKQIRGIETF